MGLVNRWLWIFALVASFIVGCNEVINTAPLHLTVVYWEPPPLDEEVPLEGVRVCELDNTSNCEVTDAKGTAILMLPFDQETGFTKEKEGYGSWLIATVISSPGESRNTLIPSAQHLSDMHKAVMSPYPMRGTGTVSVAAGQGATFELVAATGNPWYFSEEWIWSSELTKTTSVGIGGFTEVTPGEVEVKAGGTADRCVADTSNAWPSDEENTIRLPVREGYVTHGIFNCPVQP